MHLITIPNMIDTVRHVVIGENEPCFFWGPPGCGKSEGMAAAAKAAGSELIDIRLGQYASVDLRGIPFVEAITSPEATQHALTTWAQPSTFPFVGNPKFNPDTLYTLFLDEANAAGNAVQGPAYQLVQEHRIGEHILLPNVYICAAGNRESDRGVTNKLAAPLANRFTHFEVGPDAESWVQWASTQERIPAEMLAYIMFRKTMICNFDPKSPEKAFATPRTIRKACKYDTSPTMPETIRDASIAGAVGEAFAAEYIGFKKVIKDMPSIAAIKDDPMGTPVSEKLEVRWAVAVGIAGELKPNNEQAYSRYLARMGAEFEILAWQLGIRRDNALYGTPGFIEIARKHMAIFAHVNAER